MKNTNAKWTLIIILLFLLPIVSAVNYPQLTGFVTDNANMIDPEYEAKITQLAEKIEKETTVEIAVVTIESLEGETREMYAVHLFERAGIGKKDKDNGLLILVAKQEREYRFEVGYGLEGIITDSMKVNIGERIIVPNFRNGEYGKGIYESMLIVEELLKGNEEVISDYESKGDDYIIPSIFIGIIILILFIDFLFNYYKNRNYRKIKKGKVRGIALGILLSVWIIISIISPENLPILFAIVIFILIILPDPYRTSRYTGGGFGGGSSGSGGFGGGSSGGGGFGGSW
jgi:uncharacterized protein